MNKINNPYLKQLISEIANKTAEGRITGVSWGLIDEAKKKKSLKKEADEKKKDSTVEEPTPDAGELPPMGGADEAPKDAPKDAPAEKAAEPKKDAVSEPSAPTDEPKGADKAKEDAAQAKAELEKAKAEKDQAEEELKQHTYVKLGSSGGMQFMLGKLLGHAFKTNTIDALASEMAQKLKITTDKDASAFEEDMALYRNIPGMADLLSSIRTIATKTTDETPAE